MKKIVLGLFMVCVLGAVVAPQTSVAATEDEGMFYLSLQAKVLHLTKVLERLQAREEDPVTPSFVTGVGPGTVAIAGTVALYDDAITVCGPMVYGTIDWGDGKMEPMVGLGCSGVTHEFTSGHKYVEAGRYTIVVTDLQERTETKKVSLTRGVSTTTPAVIETETVGE